MSKKRSAGGGQSAGDDLRCFASAATPVTSNYCATVNNSLDFMDCSQEIKTDFDMGTEFGRKEHSKVRTVEFTRGSLAQSFDIYYASREALIAMGVPITNELQVNLPQSFPTTYCTPPKNWIG